MIMSEEKYSDSTSHVLGKWLKYYKEHQPEYDQEVLQKIVMRMPLPWCGMGLKAFDQRYQGKPKKVKNNNNNNRWDNDLFQKPNEKVIS